MGKERKIMIKKQKRNENDEEKTNGSENTRRKEEVEEVIGKRIKMGRERNKEKKSSNEKNV